MEHKKISFAVLIDCELSFFFGSKICESARAPDNASVQGVRAGSELFRVCSYWRPQSTHSSLLSLSRARSWEGRS